MHQVQLSNKQSQRGVTLLEVAIGISLLAAVLVMTLYSFTLFIDTRSELIQEAKAVYLAEEGLEILRYIRDEDWTVLRDDLSKNTIYYFDVSSTYVATTTTPELIDGIYNRQFELWPVRRDAGGTGPILASTTGAAIDPETVMAVVRVGYGDANGQSTTTLKTILTNIYDI